MTKDPRQGAKDALNKYYSRLEKERQKEIGPRRTNEKPEKEVEKACLEWMRARGWPVNIYEAKSTYSPEAGRWISQSMRAGTSDCMGNTDKGISVAIEFKAPGRLSSFNSLRRHKQKEFIIEKIRTNSFACVVDSAEKLEKIYTAWSALSGESAKNFLLSMLPKEREKTKLDNDLLFPEDGP